MSVEDLELSITIVLPSGLPQKINGFLQSRCCVPSPEEAAALAIRESLSMAIEMGFNSLHVESNSLRVINLIKRNKENFSQVGVLVTEIIMLAKSLKEIRFTNCHRDRNLVAHEAARLVVEEKIDGIWLEEAPKDLQWALQKDCRRPSS